MCADRNLSNDNYIKMSYLICFVPVYWRSPQYIRWYVQYLVCLSSDLGSVQAVALHSRTDLLTPIICSPGTLIAKI